MIRGQGRWGPGHLLAWILAWVAASGAGLPLGAQEITGLGSVKMPSDPVEALLVLRQEWGLWPEAAATDQPSHRGAPPLAYRIGDELLEEAQEPEAVIAALTAQLERVTKLADGTALEESQRASFKKAYGVAECRVRDAASAGLGRSTGEREEACRGVREAFTDLLHTLDSLLTARTSRPDMADPRGFHPPRGT